VSVRAGALGAGLGIAVIYAATAILSGHLSPLARQPLLDGYGPPTPYRWVDPPPELAATNEKPTPGRFEVNLGNKGSETAVFTTGDAQVTLIFPEGSFANAEGQRSVKVTVEPLPSSIVHPEEPLNAVGNAYLIEATYLPSGDAAKLASLATVVLVYPLLANHGSHSMIWSRSGNTWRALDTDDLPSIQQAGADIDELGYLSVAGQPLSPPAGAGTADGGSVATIAIVAGLAVLVVVALWAVLPIVRTRSRLKAPAPRTRDQPASPTEDEDRTSGPEGSPRRSRSRERKRKARRRRRG